MRSILLISALAWVYSGAAQYDLGGSGGPSWKAFMPRQGDPHAQATFYGDTPGWTANLFYREQLERRVNLGLDLGWSRQSFFAAYYSGGLASGSQSEVAVVLHTLDVGILPEWRLTPSGDNILRFGITGGFQIAGRKNGYVRSRSSSQWQEAHFIDAKPQEFGGEFRALVGFGIRIPAGDRDAITLDPYAALGLSSMLKVQPGSRSWEVGLRLGWCWRMDKGSFSQWVHRNTPTPPSGPSW